MNTFAKIRVNDYRLAFSSMLIELIGRLTSGLTGISLVFCNVECDGEWPIEQGLRQDEALVFSVDECIERLRRTQQFIWGEIFICRSEHAKSIGSVSAFSETMERSLCCIEVIDNTWVDLFFREGWSPMDGAVAWLSFYKCERESVTLGS